MAIDILNDPGMGSRISTSLRGGISQGLQALAQTKLQQIQQRNIAQKWQQAAPNLPPELAQLIATAPEGLQKSLLDRLEGLEFGGGAPQEGMQNIQQMQQQPNNQQQGYPEELQAMQQGAQQQGIKPVTLGANSAERRHREDIKLKQQSQIQKKNAPALKKLSEDYGIAKEFGDLARQMKDLLATGQVSTGLKGTGQSILGSLGTPTMNDATQAFDALSKRVATLSAGLGSKGQITNFKIKMEQLSKPNLGQSKKTQEQLISQLLKKSDDIENQWRAYEQLLEENNGEEPANIDSKIRIRAEKLSRENGITNQEKLELAELGNPRELGDGAEALLSDGSHVIIIGGEWKKV